ncbi:hypothetical protein F4604DRAFT_1664036 [Suillus subluteus]|nr:hypothetical protein F4604DRAFT_1664036 [Suillus subluteus]
MHNGISRSHYASGFTPYEKSEAKMSSAVERYRKEIAGLETCASGRITPALLSPVRIELPGKGEDLVKLEEAATVGARDGPTLIIMVFGEHNTVALYAANILNNFPHWQRQDSRTVKIPIPSSLTSSAHQRTLEILCLQRRHKI